jgi:biopolymer transport protein ExbD
MTSAMDTDKHEKRSASTAVPYINVTPLIDVLLVLLIIFMVVTPLKPSRFKADITTPLAQKLALVFQQRKEQRAYKVGMETRQDVKEDDRIEKTVFVKAPRAARYGDVVKVIDAIKGAGASPVGLQVDDLP